MDKAPHESPEISEEEIPRKPNMPGHRNPPPPPPPKDKDKNDRN